MSSAVDTTNDKIHIMIGFTNKQIKNLTTAIVVGAVGKETPKVRYYCFGLNYCTGVQARMWESSGESIQGLSAKAWHCRCPRVYPHFRLHTC